MGKKYKKIKFDIFPEFEIFVWVGCSRDIFFEDIQSIFCIDDIKPNIKGFSGILPKIKGEYTIKIPVLFVEGENFEVLAHEAVHLAYNLMLVNNINEDGSELLALLVENIILKVRKSFNI